MTIKYTKATRKSWFDLFTETNHVEFTEKPSGWTYTSNLEYEHESACQREYNGGPLLKRWFQLCNRYFPSQENAVEDLCKTLSGVKVRNVDTGEEFDFTNVKFV